MTSQISNCIKSGENWRFVISHSAPIKIAIERVQLERLGMPFCWVILGIDNVVVAVKQYGFLICWIFRRTKSC
jgi:hypothetical protein